MKTIGMLVAVEMDAVLRRYGKPAAVETRCGFTVHSYDMGAYTLHVIHSGAGELSAAAATALLIDRYGAELIVNFGVVGGLTEEMAQTKTCVVERVVHYDFDTSAYDLDTVPGQYGGFEDVWLCPTPALVKRAVEFEPGLKRVTCASADKFVDGAEAKSLGRGYLRDGGRRRGADLPEERSGMPAHQNRLRRADPGRRGLRHGSRRNLGDRPLCGRPLDKGPGRSAP